MRWFKHFANASEDLFVKELEARFGDSGYTQWFKLLEIIATHGTKGKVEVSWGYLQEKFRRRRTRVHLFLNFCTTSKKISVTSVKEKLIIDCRKFAEYADNYTKYDGLSTKRLQRQVLDTSKQEEEVDVEVDKDVQIIVERIKNGTALPTKRLLK